MPLLINDSDDKSQVILAVFVVCIIAMIIQPAPIVIELVEKLSYGLFGMAVGKALK